MNPYPNGSESVRRIVKNDDFRLLELDAGNNRSEVMKDDQIRAVRASRCGE
jgi:hypothetical protein